MTVTAAETRVEYSGNGTTKVFAYPYQFFQNDDLDLWLFPEPTGPGVQQILGVDYTVSGAMNPSGGNITMTVAPPSGTTLIIINDPDIVQTTHYVNADDFPADSHEQALDRLTKICQRLSDRIDRAIRAPDYAPEDQVPDADTLVGLVEEAQQAATDSAASAETSGQHADSAAASAASAADSAASVAGDAAAAQAAAATATTKAGEAANSAASAANSALEAQIAEVNWRGPWSASINYDAHDAVSYTGSSYIATTINNLNKPPDTHPSDWDLLAQKGQPGAPGAGTGDMLRANNLSDLTNIATARSNLSLGGAALLEVGTTPNTVAAGDDARFAAATAAIAAKVAKAGDTMTGHLSLPTAPAAANAVRKDYVDAADATLQAAIAALPAPPVAATAAEYLANSAPTKMLTPGAAWTAAGAVTLAEAASMVPDFSLGIDFQLNMTASGNTIADPINIKPGQKGVIFIAQDATGSRTLAGWGAKWKFPGGVKPTLSTAPFAWDAISYSVRTASAVLCTSAADFK